MPELRLAVDGRLIRGFESGSLSSSMDRFASGFKVEYYADILEGGDAAIIETGDAAEVHVDDESALKGWVTKDVTKTGASKLARTVAGTSKLGDLVKCSAFHSRRRFRDISLIDLATELTQPYGIAIYDRTENVEPLGRWALTEGSSIADELMRAAKARGVVLLDEAGDLVIAPAGEFSTQTVIRETNRFPEATFTRDHSDRFSEYVVKSKRRRQDGDGATSTQVRTTVRDEGVRRFRRHVVQPFGEKPSDVEKRAILERNVRAGRSEEVSVTMPGWTNDEGEIWRPNTRVRVEDAQLRIQATLLVVGTNLVHDIGSKHTELHLTRPEAFDAVVEYPVRPRGAQWE